MQKKTIPSFRTDEEAEHFVDTADLSEYDLSGFVPARFLFSDRREEAVPVPAELLSRVDARASREGKKRDVLIEEFIERGLREEAA